MMFIQFPTIISIIQILSLSCVRAGQEFITSDGVVYGNSLVMSTIKPPEAYISTSYYTTARVGLRTLSNSFVTATTESVVVSSIVGEFGSAHAYSTSSPGSQNENNISLLWPSSSYSITSDTVGSSSSSEAMSSSSTFEGSTFASVSSLKSSSDNFAGGLASTGGFSSRRTLFSGSSITATLSPTPTSSTSADKSSSSSSTTSGSSSSLPATSEPKASSSASRSLSLSSNMKPFSTAKGSDGTCTIYYDDADYYSTVYLTSPGQSVDAATTLTRTKTVYKTITNSFN